MVRASLALLRPVFAALQPAPPLLRSAPASLRPASTMLRLASTLLRPAITLLRPPARTWRHDSSLRPPGRFHGQQRRRLSNLDSMTDAELARYASGARRALEFTATPEERSTVQRWVARLLLEIDWR